MAKNSAGLPNLTLQEILNFTPDAIRSRGLGQCGLVAKQYSFGSRDGFARSRISNPVFYNEMRITSRCTAEKRFSYIRFFGPPVPNSRVWVWCSCPHFAYNVEYVLAQYGSSSVSPGYENRGVEIANKPPIVRNEGNLPYLCKHLILCASEALKQTRDLAGDQKEQSVFQKKYPGQKKPSYQDKAKAPGGPPVSSKFSGKKSK